MVEDERFCLFKDQKTDDVGVYDNLDDKILSDVEIVELLNYYRRYAILFLQDFDLYSDSFLNTIESIHGKEYVDRIRASQDEIIEASKREDLWSDEEEDEEDDGDSVW